LLQFGPLAAASNTPVSQYAFDYCVGPHPEAPWFDPPVFTWTCPACGQVIRDRGPVLMPARRAGPRGRLRAPGRRPGRVASGPLTGIAPRECGHGVLSAGTRALALDQREVDMYRAPVLSSRQVQGPSFSRPCMASALRPRHALVPQGSTA
jgi:hypothetical protein